MKVQNLLQIFFSRLKADGLFTVSRWYSPENLGETGRLVSLATATLLREGVQEPEAHLVLVTSGNMATLIVSKRPFTPDELTKLAEDGLELSRHRDPRRERANNPIT